MTPETHYYFILDLQRLAKMEGCIPFLYEPCTGWVMDKKGLLTDRIIGSAAMLLSVEEIPEEKALALMDRMATSS
jgi:hypothetical protein